MSCKGSTRLPVCSPAGMASGHSAEQEHTRLAMWIEALMSFAPLSSGLRSS